MAQINREFELKLTLDKAQMRRIRHRPAVKALTIGQKTTRTLRSIYYDTLDMSLRKSGIALRTRKVGRHWVQTVKAKGQVTAGIANHVEIETPASGAAPSIDSISDETVREKILAAMGDQPLSPVIETHIKRTSFYLSAPSGGKLELCLDVGKIRAGDRSARLREAEIELIDGDPSGVFQVAELIFAGEVLRYSACSKSARGYRLLAGETAEPALEPVFAKNAELTSSMSADEAMQAILRTCFAQIAGNLPVAIMTDEPEGPHQLRVGLRRLRSALSLLKPLTAKGMTGPLSADAKSLGRVVGALRDMDVLIRDVVASAAHAAGAEKSPEFKSLNKAILARRNVVKANVAKGLSSSDAQRLPLTVGAFAEGKGWRDAGDLDQPISLSAPVRDFASAQLDKRWRKVAEWGERIEGLTIAERHEMRKELKKLRYPVDFFGSIYPAKRVKPFRKQLKQLQNIFGHLNDSAMAMDLLPKVAGDDPVAAFAAGRVIGWCDANAEIAWRDAKDRWAALQETPAFWR